MLHPRLKLNLLFHLFTLSALIYRQQEDYDRVTLRTAWNAEYDYVVVGGGSAGALLASRLAEQRADISVLLLEAGGSETVASNTPALSDTLLGTMMDWRFVSTPTTSGGQSCLAMEGGGCVLSSGRVVGGSSSIGRGYYLRGHPDDYDEWESRLGKYRMITRFCLSDGSL